MSDDEKIQPVRTDGEIHAVDGVLVPRADAEYLVKMIDHLVYASGPTGGTPSRKLMEVRHALAVSARVDASDGNSQVPLVVAFALNSIVGVKEAASVLGIKEDTVRWHVRQGHLLRKSVRPLMIDASSLDAFAARRSA